MQEVIGNQIPAGVDPTSVEKVRSCWLGVAQAVRRKVTNYLESLELTDHVKSCEAPGRDGDALSRPYSPVETERLTQQFQPLRDIRKAAEDGIYVKDPVHGLQVCVFDRLVDIANELGD